MIERSIHPRNTAVNVRLLLLMFTPQDRLFTSLVKAVWVFASLYAKSFDHLGEEVRSRFAVIARRWPESRLACLDIMDVFAKQLSSAGALPISDLINQLRRSETFSAKHGLT
jgi:hypothetical protein